MTIVPNPDESTTSPIFADCANNLVACDNVMNLNLGETIATTTESFGAVKSLYGN